LVDADSLSWPSFECTHEQRANGDRRRQELGEAEQRITTAEKVATKGAAGQRIASELDCLPKRRVEGFAHNSGFAIQDMPVKVVANLVNACKALLGYSLHRHLKASAGQYRVLEGHDLVSGVDV
jgi:hypothetical protein